MSDPQALARLAPAKVNLFLHVGPVDQDGFHPLSSWVVFASIGDQVRLEPGNEADFVVEGPFAAQCGEPSDNLMLRAEQAFLNAHGSDLPTMRLVLEKHLPVAAGLGGGSSDAATTLHLLNQVAGNRFDTEALKVMAQQVGSDGPMCVQARSCLAEGRGGDLSEAPDLPELHAVLVNPMVPVATGAVYGAFDAQSPCQDGPLRPELPVAFSSARELADYLAEKTRNDLEAPAKSLADEIDQVLFLLRCQPQTLLARMSGSGATCFALCESEAAAKALAINLFIGAPDWWVRPCRLS